jgi:2-iminobutanoate/2-iminopropanoate deaminase
MSSKEGVLTDNAPGSAHVLSQGVEKGGWFQAPGQGPTVLSSNQYIGAGDVRVQTRRTMGNVKAILEAGG